MLDTGLFLRYSARKIPICNMYDIYIKTLLRTATEFLFLQYEIVYLFSQLLSFFFMYILEVFCFLLRSSLPKQQLHDLSSWQIALLRGGHHGEMKPNDAARRLLLRKPRGSIFFKRYDGQFASEERFGSEELSRDGPKYPYDTCLWTTKRSHKLSRDWPTTKPTKTTKWSILTLSAMERSALVTNGDVSPFR